MNRKLSPLFRALIGLIGVLLLALQGVSAQDQPTFRIGVLDTERGAISNGARLAVRTINAGGGVVGADGTTFQLDLLSMSVTNEADLQTAVDAFRTAGVVAVLGPETTAETLNQLAGLQGLNVPILTPATGDTVLASDSTGMLFRTRAADAEQGQALANYLIGEYNLRAIVTVQLDTSSSASILGFTTAAADLGVTPQQSLSASDTSELDSVVPQILNTNPAVVVAYGSPGLAANLYAQLRSGGWNGVFAYDNAFDPTFRTAVPAAELSGVMATMTWSFTSVDQMSAVFLNAYIRTYGQLPGAVDAASYDSVQLIADALSAPGSLRDNLANAPETSGVQGTLNALGHPAGELSSNVAIVRLGELGAPEVLARYVGGMRLADLPPVTNPANPASPTPTLTPEGVTITITQSVQNVRKGPSTDYEILGQLSSGEQTAVVGASLDYEWVVINFRGQQGWLAAYLADVTGDLRSVPVVQTPPTPTPNVPPTPTLSPYADVIIASVVAVPTPIIPNQNFIVNVTVRNIGNVPTGQFAVAGTFPPNNTYLVALAPALAPGQSAVVSMSGILTGTGSFTIPITVDANNQVDEGPIGEQNNTYDFSYVVGQNVSAINQGTATLTLGDTLDLEGNLAQGDVNWNGDGGTVGLKSIFGSRLGILNGDYNTLPPDSVNSSSVNRNSIPRTEMNPGTLVGIFTADGNRGIMQVNAINDSQITLTYKVFN